MRTRHVRAILDAMAQIGRFNSHSIQHIKSFLSGIFRLVVQQGHHELANPVHDTSLPKTREAEETRTAMRKFYSY